MRSSLLVLIATTRIASADYWDPLDSSGWPKGETPESLRDLPACERPLRYAVAGERIPCRPPLLASGPRLAFTMDWTSGPAFGNPKLTGGVQAWGLELVHAAARTVQLGVRYELAGIGAMEASQAFGQHLFGIARYRAFVDELGRSAWTLSAGGGWAIRRQGLGGGAPIARLAIGREIGMYIGGHSAIGMGLELAYEHNFGDEVFGAVLASARFGFELNVHEPKRWSRGGASSYSVGGGVLVLPIGFDLGLGVRRGPLALHTTLSHIMGMSRDGELHGIDGAMWSIMSGPRFHARWMYLQVQAGAGWLAADTGREIHAVGQGELGVSSVIGGCTGVDVAFWMRGDLDDERRLRGGGFLLRVWRADRAHGGRDCSRSRGETTAFFAREPEPPPPPAPPPERVVVEHRVVEPPPPPPPPVVIVKPVVVDLTLGAEWLGVTVQIDPRLLPIAQLRSTGYVEVELFGPANALARFEAGLRTTLDRNGARVDTWMRTATTTAAIRVRFTIWPPGTRPVR